MENKIISIDIAPNSLGDDVSCNAGVMWEHNATILKFNIDESFVGDYKYYIEYRSLMGTKVRTEYLELDTATNTVTYYIPVVMSSLKGVECYFNIVNIDDDGITQQVIKPERFCLTFDYSPDTDNSLAKVNDFSINALLEAIRLGTFKGDKGEKGDKGDKGEKGDTGGISEQYATSNFSNTLKGHLKGAVVTVDDASPVEHNVSVRVSNKNLLPDTVYDFANWQKSTASQGTYSLKLKDNETYTISAERLNTTDTCYLYVQLSNDGFATTKTVIAWQASNWSLPCTFTLESGYECRLYWYSEVCQIGEALANIQIELGNTATEYTPHTDPATVSLTACGKNILPNNLEEKTEVGVKLVPNEDGSFSVNGTAVMSKQIEITTVTLPAGSYCMNSCRYTDANGKTAYFFIAQEGVTITSTENNIMYFTVDKTTRLNVRLYVTSGAVLENVVFKPQIEIGNKATAYEAYNGATYTPNTDGTVDGVASLSPHMTLMTDTDGIIIECEYNKDINKVVESLVNAIISLGGNV